jgi:hypothetical protein
LDPCKRPFASRFAAVVAIDAVASTHSLISDFPFVLLILTHLLARVFPSHFSKLLFRSDLFAGFVTPASPRVAIADNIRYNDIGFDSFKQPTGMIRFLNIFVDNFCFWNYVVIFL